jgi:hypothetical protein
MTTRIELEEERMSRRLHVIFAAHGAPILLDDTAWMDRTLKPL